MEEKPKIQISPAIIAPSKDFIVGAIQGFNAGRKLEASLKPIPEDIKPILSDKDESREFNEDEVFLANYLQIECVKCGYVYTFNNSNEIPTQTMKCTGKNCDNILIVYGIADPKYWRIGNIKL